MFEAAQSYSALIKVLPLIHAIHPKSANGCLKLHRSTVHLFEPELLFVPSVHNRRVELVVAVSHDALIEVLPFIHAIHS